jgi:hypothetical protein
MIVSRFLALVATVLVSGATGWVLNQQWRAPGENAALPGAESSASSVSAPSPMPGSGSALAQYAVTLFDDGTVTVNVQKRSLKWLLEEIARQVRARGSAPASVQDAAARPATVGNEASVSEAEARKQDQMLQMLLRVATIREGDEKARYEALLKASSYGQEVPPETLKSIYETDTSERVRLLAFQQYLDGTQSASLEQTRATLQDALGSTSETVRTEAQRLLDELAASEADRARALPQQYGN